MAVKNRIQERQKLTSIRYLNKNTATNNFLFTMLATFGGVMIGVLAALSIVKTDIHTQVAAETAKLNNQVVRYANADLTTGANLSPQELAILCAGSATPQSSPAGAGNTTPVTTAAVSATPSQPAGGQGGGQPGTTNNYVHKLVSGVWANVTGTNSNTGPESNNQVDTTIKNTTVVKNDTDVKIQNATLQNANSGDAKVTENTNAGAAASGDASNTNATDFTVNTTN